MSQGPSGGEQSGSHPEETHGEETYREETYREETDREETLRGLRRFRRTIVAVGLVAVGLIAVISIGSNRPADPRLGGDSRVGADPQLGGDSRVGGESRVAGFGEVAFRIRPAAEGDGEQSARQLCALLAETGDQHARGLMGRRDLAGYDGMVFRFASDSASPFYMRNVPVPLSVAWFDSEGRFVSSADMAPCENRDDCPRYFPVRAYRFALEVLEGGLAPLGVGPGAELSVGGACRQG